MALWVEMTRKKNARQKLLHPRFGWLQHFDETILNVYIVVGLLHHPPLSLLQKCGFARDSTYGFCSQNHRVMKFRKCHINHNSVVTPSLFWTGWSNLVSRPQSYHGMCSLSEGKSFWKLLWGWFTSNTSPGTLSSLFRMSWVPDFSLVGHWNKRAADKLVLEGAPSEVFPIGMSSRRTRARHESAPSRWVMQHADTWDPPQRLCPSPASKKEEDVASTELGVLLVHHSWALHVGQRTSTLCRAQDKMMEKARSINHLFPVLCHCFAGMFSPGDLYIIFQVLCQSSKEDVCWWCSNLSREYIYLSRDKIIHF